MAQWFEWQDGERRWRVPFDLIGEGRPVVCLPAPSTISTREEVAELARHLAAAGHSATLCDWPGFGEADRERIRYAAPLYVRFLAAFLDRFDGPIDVVASGHAASFALDLARRVPARFRRLVLLAPTWRGPLPTAMGPRPRAWSALEALVCAPVVGGPIYALNASRTFVRWMMRRHVYADASHITEAVLAHRLRTAHRRNARFAAAAFVTGGLDVFRSRADFLDAARACAAGLSVVIGEATPPKSLAEMQALAGLSNVRSTIVPGSLAFYDEYPGEAAAAVGRFLGEG